MTRLFGLALIAAIPLSGELSDIELSPLQADGTEPLEISAPVGATTLLRFPGEIVELLDDPETPCQSSAIALRPTRYALLIQPSSHPSSCQFRASLASEIVVVVRIQSGPAGDAAEVAYRVHPPGAATPPPPPIVRAPGRQGDDEGGDTPVVEAFEEPTVELPLGPPEPTPEEVKPTLDLSGLVRAEVQPIGRREDQAGRPAMVLVDAMRGAELVWLRFELRRGRDAKVASIEWTGEGVLPYLEEPTAKGDLRVVVQLPREGVSKKTRVTIHIQEGGTYKFALNSGSFSAFLKSIFR